jgi:hypothetical protein
MAVHPIYYDARQWPTDEQQLAGDLFNFSFQMLRNHVLRGLEQSAGVFGNQMSKAVKSSFIAMVGALAQGARGSEIATFRQGSGTMLAHSRALRDRYVAIMVSGA